jgi:hypothetical protein
MTDKIYYIGNKDEVSVYEANINNIDAFPLKNLPMNYFPFYYNQHESSVEKMQRLVPLIENYTKITDIEAKSNTALYTIDIDKLFSLLTSLEEKYQPFNNKNIFHITVVIIIIWTIIGIFLLKIFSYIFKDRYSYFILFMIFILLVFATAWSLLITSKSF